MSNHNHAIVWIDHQQAKIFRFDATDVNSATIRSSHPHEHIHHKANSGDSGHVPVEKERIGVAPMPSMRAGRQSTKLQRLHAPAIT